MPEKSPNENYYKSIGESVLGLAGKLEIVENRVNDIEFKTYKIDTEIKRAVNTRLNSITDNIEKIENDIEKEKDKLIRKLVILNSIEILAIVILSGCAVYSFIY